MKLGGSLKVFRIGSCRGVYLPPYRLSPLEFCNQALGYTHGTKEVIQLIKLLRGETNVPRELYPYIFSFYSGRDRLLDFERCWDENARALRECDAVVMEMDKQLQGSKASRGLPPIRFMHAARNSGHHTNG